MSFECVVVTPEQQVLEATVSQAIVPGHDGQVGILTGRAPILLKLGVGTLRVDEIGGKQRTFFIDGGVAQMKDNRLTILTDEAMPADQINAESARAEQAEAEARVATDAASRKQKEHQLARARVKRQIAG